MSQSEDWECPSLSPHVLLKFVILIIKLAIPAINSLFDEPVFNCLVLCFTRAGIDLPI